MSVTQEQVEALLADLPVGTPEEVELSTTAIQMFINLRNAAFEGTGVQMLGVAGSAFSIPSLIQQLQREQYVDAAQTLLGMVGDAAGAFSLLTTAALEAGAITSATSGVAQAGVVAGMVGEALGPAGIAIATLVETFRIPSAVNENLWKIYYIADVSGILTSWLFARRDISPHDRLVVRARRSGYMRTDISDACVQAHRRAHQFWVRQLQPSLQVRRAARSGVGGSWERYWEQLGSAIEGRFQPFPTGIAASFIRRLIGEANQRARQAARAADARRRRETARAAAGGEWVITSDGLQLFIPDE